MCDPLHFDDDRVLNHAPNAAVIQFLKARAVRRPDGRYEEHTHWDLVELLRTPARTVIHARSCT